MEKVFVSGGSGYTNQETVTITGQTSGANNANATATVDANANANNAITGLSINSGGSGYINGETVTINSSSGGSGATAVVTSSTAKEWTGGVPVSYIVHEESDTILLKGACPSESGRRNTYMIRNKDRSLDHDSNYGGWRYEIIKTTVSTFIY